MALKEKIAQAVFAWASFFCAGITLAVLGFMVVLSLPVIESGQLWAILTDPWAPYHGRFGILAMILGTVYIAGLSLLISFPVSLGCALFIEMVRPDGPGRLLRKMVQLMTAVPTVVYGFVGVFLLVPLVREWFAYGSGMCILSAALMLGLLISPTMILFFSQSVARVPKAYIDAVDALGGTPFQKLVHVILPQAWPGILTGMVLAFGRAMGDTLIALMLAGNSVRMPSSVLDSARTLTSHIAMVMAADFDSIEFRTIFVSGAVLYLLTGLGVFAVRLCERQGQ